MEKSFIYQDAKGNISFREVNNISETETHIQCICLKSAALRTFRKDRVLEYIEDEKKVEERIKFYNENLPKIHSKPRAINRNLNHSGSLEICFTGFKKEDKNRLISIAEKNNLFIRSSVTRGLDFLCCGQNAGPKKIEKSRHQGVIALSETQLLMMLETGEIPEEA